MVNSAVVNMTRPYISGSQLLVMTVTWTCQWWQSLPGGEPEHEGCPLQRQRWEHSWRKPIVQMTRYSCQTPNLTKVKPLIKKIWRGSIFMQLFGRSFGRLFGWLQRWTEIRDVQQSNLALGMGNASNDGTFSVLSQYFLSIFSVLSQYFFSTFSVLS